MSQSREHSPRLPRPLGLLFTVALVLSGAGCVHRASEPSPSPVPAVEARPSPPPPPADPSAPPEIPEPPANRNPEIDRLLGLLENGTKEQQKEAGDHLSEFGREVTPYVIPLLDNRDWSVRWRAANVLGEVRDPRGVRPLVRMLVVEHIRHTRWRAMWALREMDPEGKIARPLLWHDARFPLDAERAWSAVIALTMVGDREVLRRLHEGLENDEPWIRFEAISALERMHDETSSDRLRQLLEKDRTSITRYEATSVLGEICDETAMQLLLGKLIADGDPEVRGRAATSLGLCSDPRGLTALMNRLDSEKNPSVLKKIDKAMDRLSNLEESPGAPSPPGPRPTGADHGAATGSVPATGTHAGGSPR